ncbi:hypothetical protein [Stenotrophomonas sp. 24(2023)]|uniref:hypothetical protein n=1 Tax=Stenotrophomonas sp. 24(2023) TaxID=3068324 RepID=UPI0027DFD66F|nr:hypothetical protein [Stenotrophomonas sp. 24(2023)]WMJ68611.1 hypothetical protein Q9R17_15645 [Stenotrophomonas sp. 24(2023)]
MLLRHALPLGLLLAAASGCASRGEQVPAGETPECATYRSMMTAPMDPHAMKQLRDACNASNRR